MRDGLLIATELQRKTLRLYGELMRRRESWAGKLVFACGEGASGIGLGAAVSIAGGTSLVVDPDGAGVKAVFRQGGVDFVVNTLDEALRVLKNEVRKRKPVSVALQMDEAAALGQLVERGVLPEMFTAFVEMQAAQEAAEQFDSLGAAVVRFGGLQCEGMDAEARLEGFTAECGLKLESLMFANGTELRAADEALLKVVSEGDPRRRWFASASRFFHRERPHRRVGYLTQAERERLV